MKKEKTTIDYNRKEKRVINKERRKMKKKKTEKFQNFNFSKYLNFQIFRQISDTNYILINDYYRK